jgi:zinc transporter ZupT
MAAIAGSMWAVATAHSLGLDNTLASVAVSLNFFTFYARTTRALITNAEVGPPQATAPP